MHTHTDRQWEWVSEWVSVDEVGRSTRGRYLETRTHTNSNRETANAEIAAETFPAAIFYRLSRSGLRLILLNFQRNDEVFVTFWTAFLPWHFVCMNQIAKREFAFYLCSVRHFLSPWFSLGLQYRWTLKFTFLSISECWRHPRFSTEINPHRNRFW